VFLVQRLMIIAREYKWSSHTKLRLRKNTFRLRLFAI